MSKRLLTVLSICFVVAAGIALYVWASGCCSGDPLCNGSATKVVGEGCYYDFEVYLDRDCVDTTTVRLKIREHGTGNFSAYMCLIMEEPPYNQCVRYGVRLQLDPDKEYDYYFETASGCSGRDPDAGVVLLSPACN